MIRVTVEKPLSTLTSSPITLLELSVLRQVVMLGLRMWLVGMLVAPLIPALAMLCFGFAGQRVRAQPKRDT